MEATIEMNPYPYISEQEKERVHKIMIDKKNIDCFIGLRPGNYEGDFVLTSEDLLAATIAGHKLIRLSDGVSIVVKENK